MRDPYALLADYYDLLIPDWESASRGAGDWLDGILRPLGMISLLDCTCGTGLQSIALAQKGYRVTGSDASKPMLKKARQNALGAGVNVRWLHADICLLRTLAQDRFDAVITCGSSLFHLPSADQLRQALENMYAVTREGGCALIAVASSEDSLKQSYPFISRRVQLPDGSAMSFFTMTKRNGETVTLNLFIVRDTNNGPKVTHTQMLLRLHSQQELSDLLAKVGYGDVRNLSRAGSIALLARKP